MRSDQPDTTVHAPMAEPLATTNATTGTLDRTRRS